MKKIFICLLLFVSLPLIADTPQEIVSDAYLFSRSSDFILSVVMDIHGDRGNKERSMDITISQGEDHYNVLMEVTAPSFLSNMKYLQLVDLDSNNDQQWLKNSRGVRRLSSSNRGDRLFDSDFTVEDLSRLDPELFNFSEIGQNEEFITIRAVPIPSSDVAERILRIDKEDGLIYEIFILGEDGSPMREYRVISEIELENEVIPMEIRMDNVVEETFTLLKIEDYQLDARISARAFNKGSL